MWHCMQVFLPVANTALLGRLLTITPLCTDGQPNPPSVVASPIPIGLLSLSFHAAEGCSSLPDTSVLVADGTSLISCADAPYGPFASLCGPAATCGVVPVGGAPALSTAVCTCVAPAYPQPIAASEEIVPYTAGCVTPRQGSRVSISGAVADSLILRLDKGLTAPTEARTLVLQMAGTDVAAAIWRVSAASVPSWLQIASSGAVGAAVNTVSIPIVVSSSGLVENVEPYQASLQVMSRDHASEPQQALPPVGYI